MKTLAPIVLFCYNRPDTLRHTIEALRDNYWAEESELFIFSDGAKKPADEPLVAEVRDYLQSITGFKSLVITEATVNKGLANSIIGGVQAIIDKYDKVIVLEDDLVSSRNFLVYMNKALDYYRQDTRIFSITGFSIPIRGLSENSVYYTQRANSTGWGTWKDRWNGIDWEVRDYSTLMNDRAARRAFNQMGSDMTGLLVKQKTGKINSWAIRWCYHQFKYNLYSVHPALSKIKNIGYAKGATHTREKFNRFETKLDTGIELDFHFERPVVLERKIIRQFTRPYSIPYRAAYKLLNIVFGSSLLEELITFASEIGI
jgi:hypothetical protein